MGRLLAYSSPGPSKNRLRSEFPIRSQQRNSWKKKKRQTWLRRFAYFAEISTFATLGPNSGKASRAIELGALAKPLFGAIERLINLLAEPECIPVLSPLVQKEIVFRLLTTECGPKIRQIATGGSHIHQSLE